jgi:SLT domain-containing protein
VAGEIFVGSVAVGVVPDLRGFNTEMQRQLVPAASRIGNEIGTAISKGIVDNLRIGRIVDEATVRDRAVIARAGFAAGSTYGTEMRRGIESKLVDLKATVNISADTTAARAEINRLSGTITEQVKADTAGARAEIARLSGVVTEQVRANTAAARLEIDRLSGVVNERIRTIGGISGVAGTGAASTAGGGAGGLAAALIGALLGGGRGGRGGRGGGGVSRDDLNIISRLLGSDPLSRAIAAERLATGGKGGGGGGGILGRFGGLFGAGGGAGGAGGGGTGAGGAGVAGLISNPFAIGGGIAAALPFLGQALGGLIVSGLGTALAGIGVAGAVGLGGTDPAVAAKAGQQAQLSRQRLVIAEQNLQRLQSSGKATAQQLAQAELAVSSARIQAANATNTYRQAQKTALTTGQQAVRDSFSSMVRDIQHDLSVIGAPFIPVLRHVFQVVKQVFDALTPVFKGVMDTIGPPLMTAIDVFLKAFTQPAVVNSIKDIANAFVLIVEAFTPDIPTIMKSLGEAISGVANAIAAHPQAFAQFLNFIGEVVVFALRMIEGLTYAAIWIEQHWNIIKWILIPFITMIDQFIRHGGRFRHEVGVIFDGIRHEIVHVWDIIWNNTIAKVIQAGHDLLTWFNRIRHWIANIFDGIRHDVAHYWDMIWNNTIGRIQRGFHDVAVLYDTARHNISHWFDVVRHDIATAWDTVWSNTIGRATRGWHDLMGVIGNLKTDITKAFSTAVNWLKDAGWNLIHGLFNGIWSVMKNIWNWINFNVVQPVIRAVKHFFGISSPSTVFAGVGKDIMGGLIHGMLTGARDLGGLITKIFGGWPKALAAAINKGLIDVGKLPKKAWDALGHVPGWAKSAWNWLTGGGGGGAPSGVQQWAPTVLQALSLVGLPSSLASRVLYQMQTESGGNVRAINLTDINAQMGDPSKGLMQVIGGTFARFHVAGTSWDIYDPLANIAAAIAYAAFTYGPSLMRGGMGIGSGHGYAAGTGGAAAGWAWVGENGPELVNFAGGEQVLAVARGYATGTSVGTLEAEIARLNASIAILNARFGTYAAGSAGQLGRDLTSAEISVDRARIRDLQSRIYGIEHPSAVAARARTTTAAARANAAAARAAAAAATRMANAGATLAASLAKITLSTSAGTFANDLRLLLKDLRFYFSPSVADARSRLIIAQIRTLENLQTHIAALNTQMANITAFQKQELAHLQQGTGLGFIGIQGRGAAQGAGLLSGLNNQIRVIRDFGQAIHGLAAAGASQALIQQVAGMDPSTGGAYANKMTTVLRKLRALHAPAAVVSQLVALGPDAALAYADALQHSDPRTLKQIFGAESSLAATQLAVSRGVASVAYGGAYITGANFVSGLKSQEKQLTALFARLGRTLGEEAIKWFRVPAKQRPYGYQHGGWLNEPVSGWGLYSGAPYMFAETGREYVIPESQTRGGGTAGGPEYHAHFDGLTGEAIESHVRVAFNAMSLTQGNLQRQGRRS